MPPDLAGQADPRRSLLAGVLLGIGTMAAVDEIVFHQLLAWHHFYDQSTPAVALFSDGLLHAAELILLIAGVFLLSQLRGDHALARGHAWAGFFLGAGGFQLFDGIVGHYSRYMPPMSSSSAVYLTPLYALSTQHPVVHGLVHLHFVVAGYLFTWAMVGPDPAPHRPGFRTRLVVLFLATGLHAALSKIMYAHGFPRGAGRALEEVRAAAQWMYYGGDLAEIVLIVLLLGAWFGRIPLQAQLRAG